MSHLSDKAENALDEGRMLILGGHVLIGFDFEATFQPVFGRQAPPIQQLHLLGLALMLLAAGLLMTPGAFHQITECGNDTPRLLRVTSLFVSLALLPFALSIGLEVFVATQAVIGSEFALVLGTSGTAFALFFWYALDWLWRARDHQLRIVRQEQNMSEPTSLENRIKQVLTESRVVLPGAQALLGFQLIAMLTDAFGHLPQTSQYVHLASLILLASTMVFLMSPAAFHRIVEQGQDTERLHRFSSAMLLIALVPLGLGIAGDFYVVADKILNSSAIAIGLACASLVVFYGLWFGVTLAVRSRTAPASAKQLKVSRAAR